MNANAIDCCVAQVERVAVAVAADGDVGVCVVAGAIVAH